MTATATERVISDECWNRLDGFGKNMVMLIALLPAAAANKRIWAAIDELVHRGVVEEAEELQLDDFDLSLAKRLGAACGYEERLTFGRLAVIFTEAGDREGLRMLERIGELRVAC